MADQDQMTVALAALHARIDALLAQQQQHFLELASRFEGMNPTVLDQVEAFDSALDERREDRGEFAEANSMAHLHDRMNEMQQAREQEQRRSHERGMEY